LKFELHPSIRLAVLILVAHAAAAAASVAVLPGTPGWLLGGALFGLGCASAWNRALLRSKGSVRGVEIGPDAVTLYLANGDSFHAEMSRRRYVSRLFVTLPVVRPRRRTVLVTADMLGAEAFRRLRLWALWGKLPVAGKQLAA
jgi:hypothetical protein